MRPKELGGNQFSPRHMSLSSQDLRDPKDGRFVGVPQAGSRSSNTTSSSTDSLPRRAQQWGAFGSDRRNAEGDGCERSQPTAARVDLFTGDGFDTKLTANQRVSSSVHNSEKDPFSHLPRIPNEADVGSRSKPVRRRENLVDYDSIPAVAVGTRSLPAGLTETAQPIRACIHCARTFSLEVVGKHETVCGSLKKRAKFDSMNRRLAGLIEANGKNAVELLKKKVAQQTLEIPIRPRKASWRDKSDQLRAAIGVAKTTDPTERLRFENDLARITQAALTKCNFCGRSFNSDAAQRHIPLCQQKAAMIPRQRPKAPVLPSVMSATQIQKMSCLKLPSPLSPRGYRAPHHSQGTRRAASIQPVQSPVKLGRTYARSPPPALRNPNRMNNSHSTMRF